MLARDIEMFIEHCGLKGLSTKTVNSYEQTLRLFMQYMDEQGILLTEKITHLAIQGYIKSIKERGKYTVTTNPNSGNYPDRRVDFGKRVSDVTINNYLRNLRVFFNWCVEEELILRSPVKKGDFVKVERKPLEFVSDGDFKRLLKSMNSASFSEYRDSIIIQLLLDTGMRVNECLLIEVTSDMVEDKLLCYEPISKRYFRATEAALLEAFYSLNRDFALNGYASLNDLYNYLGLDYIPEGDLKGWCADYLATDWEYFWIDFSYLKQKTDDGLEGLHQGDV